LLRFLAIHAHPDDIEFQCAGTLALLKQKGHHITLATMTAGDCGSAEHSRTQIAAIRREEARQSAEVLGAEYFCLDFDDLRIVDDNPSRMRVTELLRQVSPDVVITAPPVDYMVDHEMTSRLVRQATFNAPIPNYTTGATMPAGPLESIPHLYYVDPLEGTDYFGHPQPADFFIDITLTFEIKRTMLACHASQRDWLFRQHGIDEYLEAQRRWSAKRGKQVGVEYAEAYRQHKGHPYPHDNIIGELLAISHETEGTRP
jgi:N-acetylglucosamine malate deacetylase 1